jgi:hypothetical protein
MVLVLYPLREVLPDAVRAFAANFGLGIYDARRRLEVPFPQIVGSGPRGDVEQLCRHLAAEGLACARAPAAEIGKALVPRRLTRVASLSETALEGWGPDGNAIGAPIVPWTIDLGKPRLVVVGSSMLRAPGSDKKLRFVHVWHERDGRPYELVEKDLKQFDLGARQQASARANFELVLDALAEPPARADYTLVSDAHRVGTTVVAGGAPGGADARASVPVADVISRLMWIGWQLTK